MTKFTNILPANYESDASGYVLNLYPDPDAMSVEFRMVAGKWQSAPGPDLARREGIVTTVRGRNLGAYDRMNREEGKRYTWCKLADYFAPEQPTPVATDDGERERLRSSIRTAMNRVDAAKDLLDSAFEDLADGLLDAPKVGDQPTQNG